MSAFDSYIDYLKSELRKGCKGISGKEIREFLYYAQLAFESEYEIAIKAGADHFGAREYGQEVIHGRLQSFIEDWVKPSIIPYPTGEQLSLAFYLDCREENTYETKKLRYEKEIPIGIYSPRNR